MEQFNEFTTKRPDSMSYEEYHEKRKEANARIKRYLRGRLVYIAVTLTNIGTDVAPKFVRSKNNKPFVGDASKLKFV